MGAVPAGAPKFVRVSPLFLMCPDEARLVKGDWRSRRWSGKSRPKGAVSRFLYWL